MFTPGDAPLFNLISGFFINYRNDRSSVNFVRTLPAGRINSGSMFKESTTRTDQRGQRKSTPRRRKMHHNLRQILNSNSHNNSNSSNKFSSSNINNKCSNNNSSNNSSFKRTK